MKKHTSESNLVFILFGATSYAASMMQDEGLKQNAKKYYNNWWNLGNRMWKHILGIIHEQKFAKEGIEYYNESSIFMYDVARILVNVDTNRRQEILTKLKEICDE